ncbi:uncharacterized protein DUF1292 [Mobilisporobacter senegalensis]|uniref:Uncharacterized protein DUF1292 n=1 Tax=Mobilisporobacter senegalensis TaxID=1329262 RepID=A0A3N1XVI5_9FIRM|nr:DUF1292 domain-containing protein [Mobilisporobacter senegalensis]ROR30623.1 uncharacterized protein DUF1292 [Mobilisporobacter senegalensis]
MSEKLERIVFTNDDSEEVEFYVLEQTMINGINYLLVADSDNEEDEANALILKEKAIVDNKETIYDVVENEEEILSISKIFVELLDDVDIELE